VDGQTGFLVKVGDSVGMAQFTDRILADPALAKRLGEAGRERMRTNFSVERMVSLHAELYRQVVSDDGGGFGGTGSSLPVLIPASIAKARADEPPVPPNAEGHLRCAE
jgi:hypothetical protein